MCYEENVYAVAMAIACRHSNQELNISACAKYKSHELQSFSFLVQIQSDTCGYENYASDVAYLVNICRKQAIQGTATF